MLHDGESHVPLGRIRESSKMLVAPIPFDAARNSSDIVSLQRVDVARAPYGLFPAEMHPELRYQVEEHSSFPVLHGRFIGIVKLCLSQFQAQLPSQLS